KGQLAEPFRQGHYSCQRMRRVPSYKAAYFKRNPLAICFGLVDANAAVYLIMKAGLFIELIVVTGKLYAIHTQVGIHNAGLLNILGIYLRQGNKSAAIHWPMVY